VLDFIAYDNPAYHESPFAFREYQRSFDDHIRAADQVLAISRHIGDRIQRQFAHRLLAPVRSIYPGADHLADERIASEAPSILDGVTSGNFLAVLGNDFAHKNRDFAVKVFAEMCGRGYQGHLVLAGFHLDSGSSYHYELDAAGPYRERVFRVGPLAPDEKKWLLHNAQCVLYPTSSEGFGLIPFEAAAFGAPTAFVRFGPLNETMPNVPAVRGWNVNEFASHVFALIADPAGFVASVKRDAVSLTWQRCAAETIAIYREMLGDRATWHAALANRERPDTLSRLHEAAAEYWRRAGGKMRRLTGRNSPGRER
jgi:glycosyltransferase involved in cell wall biosynthesis